MSVLLMIPGFLIESLAGAMFLGLLPGFAFIILWYGTEAYQHPEIAGYLMRPGAIVGGFAGAILFYNYADEIIKFWST